MYVFSDVFFLVIGPEIVPINVYLFSCYISLEIVDVIM